MSKGQRKCDTLKTSKCDTLGYRLVCQPRSLGTLSSSLEKVPWLRLVMCLCVQIKPIEKCKSSFNIQHTDVVDVKFLRKIFSLQEKGLTVKLSMRVIQSNSKLPLYANIRRI